MLAVPLKATPPMFLAVASRVAVAAFPDVLWLPEVFTPGKSMLEVPLKETPPMFLAVCSLVAVVAFPLNAAVIVPAVKLPEAFRLTIVVAVLALVAKLALVTALLISVWLPLTAPVTFGNVALIVLLIKRMWLSPSLMLSELVGFDTTKPLIYVLDSRAIIFSPCS
jgi:hypothetical protein